MCVCMFWTVKQDYLPNSHQPEPVVVEERRPGDMARGRLCSWLLDDPPVRLTRVLSSSPLGGLRIVTYCGA